ncbi:hypothetical protein OIU85_016712 [Salix viminalis]|uniref:Uncharacterized protein n=2 Tax=Salix TaxID=40685 RepID=A0A9Q0SVL7_9ROSI|nr:hypothetical protein OIU76_028679 [Salix suchowensis]KAJ6690975.1 hypothetical protein OIU74_015616 [Salix koriyanagi]KAJ6742654.1 hypothetical protein OIU85_016712 [Salix viminalis]
MQNFTSSEWSNAISGRESSVCSQVDDSFGKTSLKSEILRSSEELLRKRSRVERASQSGCGGKRDTIISRTTRRSAGKVLPRRSMRLVSKVLS